MNHHKLMFINRLSGVLFLIHSLCLPAILFIDNENGFTAVTYIVVSVFWIGLLLGLILQIYLSVNCKGIKKKKWKNQKFFYIVSAVAFLLMIIFVIMKISIMFFLILMLFISIISLEAALVIKKEMYLK